MRQCRSHVRYCFPARPAAVQVLRDIIIVIIMHYNTITTVIASCYDDAITTGSTYSTSNGILYDVCTGYIVTGHRVMWARARVRVCAHVVMLLLHIACVKTCPVLTNRRSQVHNIMRLRKDLQLQWRRPLWEKRRIWSASGKWV